MIPTRSTRAGRARSVVLRIEALPGGLMRVSAPDATGWAAAARTPAELARAVTAALTEADIAAYSGARGRVYDGPDRKPGARRRSDTYDPAAWRIDDLGRLVSPSGKRSYPATSWVARRVMEQRQAMGLPALPGQEDQVLQGRTGGIARRRGQAQRWTGGAAP